MPVAKTPARGRHESVQITQIRRYSSNLNDSDRKLVIAMVKKMAASPAK